MKPDLWSALLEKERNVIGGKISKYRGKSSERGRWMEEELAPLLTEECEGFLFWHLFDRATLFYHVFASEDRKAGNDSWKDDVRTAYKRVVHPRFEVPKDVERLMTDLRLRTDQIDISSLPEYSFVVHLSFKLEKPYLSRDDDAFYIIDNPIRKDKVFKVPFVAPSSWKGSLRAVATRQLVEVFARLLPGEPPTDEAEREQVLAKLWPERARRVVLFGNEKQNDADFFNKWLAPRLFPPQPEESEQYRHKRLSDEVKQIGQAFEVYLKDNGYCTEKIEGRQGRLFFFPTFFNRIGLEMINPHDRARGVGKNPILFECVPAEATGTFRLLYVPYDFPGGVTPNEAELRRQVQADLPLVAETVRDLLAVYGFGAKTSSGYGVADPQRVAGEIQVNCLDERAGGAEGPGESLVRRLLMGDPLERRLHDEFFADGQFVIVPDEEVRQQSWSGRTKADYRKVKPRVLELLADQPAGPRYLTRPVTDLVTLKEVAKNVTDALAQKGGTT